MRHRLTPLIAAAAILAASGCTLPTTQTTGKTAKTAASQQAVTGGLITGQAVGPAASVIGFGGGNVIAAGAGNVIAPGGGQVIAPGGGQFTLLALSESPLAETEVYLADAAGNPLPGIEPVKTDKSGKYKFENVPDGFTVMVVVKGQHPKTGKEALLTTLAKSTKLGATANINAASTLVTAGVVEGLSDLGDLRAATFQTAIEATAKELNEGELPDFSDRTAVSAAIKSLAGKIEALQSALDEIKQDLKDIKASLEELKQQLAKRPGARRQPPPPDGTQPPPGDQPTHEMGLFKFKLEGTHPLPLTVEVRAPMAPEPLVKLVFDSATATPEGELPIGLKHELWASVDGQARKVGDLPGLPKDAAQPVPLRIDLGGGTQTTTQTDPNATHTRPDLRFRLPTDRFKAEAYPLTLQFRVPGTTNVVAQIHYEKPAAASEGRTSDKPIPLEKGHEIWVNRANLVDKEWIRVRNVAEDTDLKPQFLYADKVQGPDYLLELR